MIFARTAPCNKTLPLNGHALKTNYLNTLKDQIDHQIISNSDIFPALTLLLKLPSILLFCLITLLPINHLYAADANLANGVMATQSTPEKVPIAIDDPASKAAVRELVATLSDADVRALLIQRLDAVLDRSHQPANSALDVIGQGFATYWENATLALTNFPLLAQTISELLTALLLEIQQQDSTAVTFVIISAILLGLLAERTIAFLLRNRKQRLIQETSTTLSGILRIIYTRLAIDIAGVMAFNLVSYAVIAANYSNQTLINQLAYCVTVSLTAFGFGYVVCRFFFAPKRPDIRICLTSDARAQRLTLSFALLTSYIIFIHALFPLLIAVSEQHFGSITFMLPLGFYLNLSLYFSAALTIWYNREGLSDVLLSNKRRVTLAIGHQSEQVDSWFADHWPKIAMTLILVKYLLVEVIINSSDVGAYSKGAVYITFIVIFLWPGVDANISLFVWKSVDIPEDETEAAGISRQHMQQGLLRAGRVLIVGSVLFTLASLWGLNILDLANSSLGAQMAGHLVEVLLVLLFAYLSWELISIFIDRWQALEGGDAPEEAGSDEIGGTGLSRVATILPIIKKTAQALIVLITFIMILDNLGVNIAPVIAGAGVLGLAIGFGAQTLVKDIVSGMFFLADDAFRVGEYIEVEGTRGNIEKISLRSLRLRHHRGLVHTIPYGEIPKLTNYSRDWVIMKLRFRVPFDADIHKIKKIFKNIGQSLLEDPLLGEDFLQPFKSQGVAEVDDNGIVIRGKFMAKPGKQFMIRKEVYVRVQKAFEEANIPFARKQVMVHIPGLATSDTLQKDDLSHIAAAAAESAEEQFDDSQAQAKPKLD